MEDDLHIALAEPRLPGDGGNGAEVPVPLEKHRPLPGLLDAEEVRQGLGEELLVQGGLRGVRGRESLGATGEVEVEDGVVGRGEPPFFEIEVRR